MRTRNRLAGIAALTTIAAVGAAKFGNRKSTGEVINVTPGKTESDGDIIEVRDDKSRLRAPVKMSIPHGFGQDFKAGDKVTYRIDRNKRHQVNGVSPGKLEKTS